MMRPCRNLTGSHPINLTMVSGIRLHCLALLALLLTGLRCPAADRASREAEADAFFSGPILRWKLRLSEAAMDSLRGDPREYVPAEVTVGGRTYAGVGVHLKGSAGSKRSVDDRPAMTLNFDRFNKGQRVFGMEKLHLNNSVQDGSYINENLASRTYRAAGIPATRATHAVLEFNGREMGFYVIKEAYDDNYLKRHFPEDNGRHGNLYDGGFIRDILQNLERDAGKGPTDQSDVRTLRDATSSPLAIRADLFNRCLDVDRFRTFMAIQMTLDDWDGYIRNRNNYRIYFRPDGRAVFLPSGMDQLLRHPDAPVRDAYMGRVANALMAMPAERVRLRDRMRSLSSNVLSESWLRGQMEEIQARLDAAIPLTKFNPQSAFPERHSHTQRLHARLEVVKRELAQWPDPLPPWPVGRRHSLSDAKWNVYVQTGKADCLTTNDAGGLRVFQVTVHEPATRATLRSSMTLPGGRYRLSGRAMTRGVDPLKDDLGIGAGLRLTGVTGTQHLEGDAPWSPLAHDFDQPEDGPVEFIVELRANRGEAWFDVGSLTVEAR
jgi:hypothetical protein